MTILEAAAYAIVALYVVVRARVDEDPRSFLRNLALLAAAAWIGEDTCIRLYGFYAYDARWSVFLDRVPLAIVVIWPVVVHSATDLARAFAPRRAVVVAAAIVLADASLIEPIAVAAGLWSWTRPGPFDVPVIGVLGWSYFALGACWAMRRRPLLVLVAGPVAAHALLLATWWGALRWAPPPTSETPFVVAAVAASIAATVAIAKARAWTRVTTTQMLLRVPAAVFFFVLLALHARDDVWLVAYALAFAPPYLLLTPWRRASGLHPAGAEAAVGPTPR